MPAMPSRPTSPQDLTMRGSRTFEPPYDDEGGTAPQTSGSLALALSLHRSGGEAPALRLLPGGRADDAGIQSPADSGTSAAEAADDVTLALARRTASSDLPAPKVFGARLVQALAEATAGERPLSQLSPYLSRAVYHRLERHFAGTVRGTGSAGQDNRANVRSVRVCEPSDGVAELAAVVRRGGRMAAIALRLEGVDGRWQCTALHIG